MRSFVLLFILLLAQAGAAETVLPDVLDSPELVGSGQYRLMLMKIYEAELYSNDGEFDVSQPFALKLTYSRKLKGEAITDKSVDLIRRQGIEDEDVLAAWYQELSLIHI